MRERLLVIVVILLLFGCKKVIPFIDNFEDKGNAIYTVVDNIPELKLYYPVRLLKIQDYFIISDYSGDKIFTALHKSGKSFQFGSRGRGPNEFIDGYGLAPLTDTSFVAFDRTLKKISFFELNQDTVIIYKRLDIPAVNNVFPYNDSIIVTNGNPPFEKSYGVVDLSKDSVYSYIDYPEITERKLSERERQREYYSHIIRKPHANRYVAFKASHYIIDVMDLDGTILNLRDRKIFANNKWETSKNVSDPGVRGLLSHFSAPNIAGSNNGIFVCYDIHEGDKSQWSILTFDWEGNPINKYYIPFIPYAITSSEDSLLYCIALIGEEYKLVKIVLS